MSGGVGGGGALYMVGNACVAGGMHAWWRACIVGGGCMHGRRYA